MSFRACALATIAAVLSTACAAARKPAFFGDWRVTSFASPGVSALTPEQAATWIGLSATYTEDLASFAEAACANP